MEPYRFGFDSLGWLNVFSDFSTVMNKSPSKLKYCSSTPRNVLQHRTIAVCCAKALSFLMPSEDSQMLTKLAAAYVQQLYVKSFNTSPGGTRNLLEPRMSWLLFVYSYKYGTILLDGSAQVMASENNPNFLGYIQATCVLQIFWFGVFLSLGSDYLTTFRQNSQFGLPLLVWRLAQISCLSSFLWLGTTVCILFIPDQDEKQKGALIHYVWVLK